MAGRYKNGRGRPGRKRKWKDMEITAVKLNPEQAVISCCDTERSMVTGSVYDQCAWQDCGGESECNYTSS